MRTVVPLLLVLLIAGACTSAAPDDEARETASDAGVATSGPATETSSGSGSAPAAAPIDDRLASQTAWVLAALDGASIDEEEYLDRVTDEFATQVPFDQFVGLLDAQLRPAGPFTVTATTPRPSGGQVVSLTGADGTALEMTVEVDDQGRIGTLFLAPAEPPTLDDPPASVDEAITRLRDVAELGLVAAEVDGTICARRQGVAVDEAVAVGSAFKLYVLGAVAEDVLDGALAWDDELTITDQVKSLPSGILQTRDSGSTVTVREAAQLMIEISDNTATDLLISAVGRDAVEEAQATYGHATPGRNTPFLTTREAFLLKADPAAGDAWAAAEGDVDARREILVDLAGRDIDEVAISLFQGDPVRPTEIEWFASPLDLCRALATLFVRAEDAALAPLLEILTANPGVPPPDDRWARIGFKGGSEPGVLTLAWIMETDDGARRALVGSLVDPTAPIEDEATQALVMGAARDLLADT